jgi:iron complex transport system substrate-binding protein
MEDILSVDERLKNIKALRVGEVYNNNARVTNQGGNDYWESGVIHPHVILKDLIKIFHPGLLPEHDLVYYQLLSD